jgi:hypothetical protein
MGIACVERRRMGFLSFYTTEAMRRDSCILHSKVPYGAFLKVVVFLNAKGKPTHPPKEDFLEGSRVVF